MWADEALTPLPALRRRRLLALLCAGVLPLPACPATKDLRVLTGPDPAAQRHLLLALKARFPAMVADADPAALDPRRPGPVVTLGPVALRRGLEADFKGPLISAFTSSQIYRQLTGGAGHERPVTALYAEAPPQAQLQLIAALFERRVTVGVLLSEESAHLERPLRQGALAAGLELVVERTEPSADVVRSLNRLGAIQVLLAVPDSTLYTPNTLRSVLESTYRRGLPVIGFSSATVTAGTLAAAFSSTDDLVADLCDLLDALGVAGGSLPDPRFPRFWRVAVNENVARSLGVPIADRVLNMGNYPSGRAG